MHFYCRNFERAVALPAGCLLDLQLSSLNAADQATPSDAILAFLQFLFILFYFILEVH
jgi:hypothetical protein